MILARLIGEEIKIRYLWFGLGRSFFSRALPQAAIQDLSTPTKKPGFLPSLRVTTKYLEKNPVSEPHA